MKPGAVKDLKALLLSLDPHLSERPYAFVELAEDAMIPTTAFAVIREEEGQCAILPAKAAGEDATHFAYIALAVHSDLEAVGLTAALATALASSGIACNIIAGLRHDHLFVPWEKRDKAMSILRNLSNDAKR